MKISIKDLKHQKSNQKTLIYIQPYLFEYRNKIIEEVKKDINIIGIFKKKVITTNLSYLDASPEKLFSFITKIIKIINLRKNFKELIFYSPAISRNIDFILIPIILKFFNFPIIIQGQGLYKTNKPNLIEWIIHFFWIAISKKYILYSLKGKTGPFKLNIFKSKIIIINNRFENFKDYAIPREKIKKFSNPNFNSPLRILFIGRDRPGSNLDFLIENFNFLANKYFLELHLIGPIKNDFSGKNIFQYGPLYNKDILNIAENCSIGIYPGDAGLSILHYMCLGLCPIFHSSIHLHEGPEPSFVTNGENGILFKRNSSESFKETLISLYKNSDYLNKIRFNAYDFSKEMHLINYSEELKNILLNL